MHKYVLDRPYQNACALAFLGTLVLLWLSLGVGIIGRDGDPANRMYLGVVAIGVLGASVSRLRARGLSIALFAMAGAQLLITVVALVGRLGLPWSGPAEIVLLNSAFIVLFAGCGWLFGQAAEAAVKRGL